MMDPYLLHAASLYEHKMKPMKRNDYNRPAVSSAQHIESECLEDSIPGFVQDVYHFTDLVYAIKNAAFNVPRCMTYGRFKYMIDTLVSCDGVPEIKCLDIGHAIDENREAIIQDLSMETLSDINNLMILSVVNKTSELLACKYSPAGSSSFVDESHTIPLKSGGLFSITYRLYTVHTVASEAARTSFLRMKAAESPTVSVRSAFMLTDIAIPLRIIPGVSNLKSLIDAAHTADVNEYRW
jgi:hypothetical protein